VTYTILTGKVKIGSDQFFKLSSSPLIIIQRTQSETLQAILRQDVVEKSLSLVDEWNCLPETVVTACTVDSFKVHLDLFMTHGRYEH